MEKILKFSKEQGYESVEYIEKWGQFDVYEPIYSKTENACIGIPLVILVEQEIIRMSTEKECIDFLDYQLLNN